MLKKLKEALSDIEQMKADLLSSGRPVKDPTLPGAPPQMKKRKAQKAAHWHRPMGRHDEAKQQTEASAAHDGEKFSAKRPAVVLHGALQIKPLALCSLATKLELMMLLACAAAFTHVNSVRCLT